MREVKVRNRIAKTDPQTIKQCVNLTIENKRIENAREFARSPLRGGTVKHKPIISHGQYVFKKDPE